MNTGAKVRECTALEMCSKENQKCGKHIRQKNHLNQLVLRELAADRETMFKCLNGATKELK